jgi:hypothetical protein
LIALHEGCSGSFIQGGGTAASNPDDANRTITAMILFISKSSNTHNELSDIALIGLPIILYQGTIQLQPANKSPLTAVKFPARKISGAFDIYIESKTNKR